jgi:hypothetical protein
VPSSSSSTPYTSLSLFTSAEPPWTAPTELCHLCFLTSTPPRHQSSATSPSPARAAPSEPFPRSEPPPELVTAMAVHGAPSCHRRPSTSEPPSSQPAPPLCSVGHLTCVAPLPQPPPPPCTVATGARSAIATGTHGQTIMGHRGASYDCQRVCVGPLVPHGQPSPSATAFPPRGSGRCSPPLFPVTEEEADIPSLCLSVGV